MTGDIFFTDVSNLDLSACASTCNVLFMRFHELNDGIEVLDEKDKPIGISKIAAKKVRPFANCFACNSLEIASLGFN